MSRRILHLAQPRDAGVARWIVDHVRRQLEAGWLVEVGCAPDGWLAARLADQDVPVHEWPARREPHRGVAGECRRFRMLLRRAAPDLVHLHSSKAGLDGRLVMRGRTPTVFSPHAWSFDAVSGVSARAALAWERASARWADRVLCVSDAERRRGVAAGVDAPWAVVPNGIDLHRHRPADAWERAAARARLGLQPDARVAVCVGRLSRQKGQDLLLDAWSQVRARDAATLALVGDGPDAAAVRERAPEGVVFPGPVDDPGAWYAAATVVVVPSRWEGMAFVPLEAMAAARSVVGFDVTGMSEAVPADAGRLVTAGNTADLAAALSTRLADPAVTDAEGAAGRRHVERHHDIDRLSSRVLGVYEQVLADTRGDVRDGGSSTQRNR